MNDRVRALRFADVEVDGVRCDVEVAHGRVTAIGPSRPAVAPDAMVVAGRGGALLPGLHDHHLHLMSAAARIGSVDCGPPATSTADDLRDRLQSAARQAGAGEWVRAVNYHESVAGPLDRDALDRIVADVPVRVQHRGGALWMLNSAALRQVEAALTDRLGADAPHDLERDGAGRATGRLWRQDALLASLVPAHPLDLGALGARLRGYGITSVTDATPDLAPATVELLAAAATDGRLPLGITLLGAATAPAPLRVGPAKILLRDHDLPSFDRLREAVRLHHDGLRPVAVHCVTRESLVLTLAVLEEIGSLPGDRIEHAAIVPTEVIPALRALGVCVVTQPDFLRLKGDGYLRDVDAEDVAGLYRHGSLLDAGISTVASSDAPFGELDPWRVMRSAVERRTTAGTTVGPADRVSARTALSGYLAPADLPGPERRIAVGAPADLVLLHTRLREALADLSADSVRATLVGSDWRG
ncbi:amidohydrolase family protein [Microbacterium sp. X-17]|uniref:amidohydrolase family protein n=1 Tax=Microbacterium sp. X-17 TaxID=3144404 RepID=UPI0031F59488